MSQENDVLDREYCPTARHLPVVSVRPLALGEWTAHHGSDHNGPDEKYPEWCEVTIRDVDGSYHSQAIGLFGLKTAHLIAAAPEMFRALENALENGSIHWEPTTDRGHTARSKMIGCIQSTLRKVRGKA